MPLRFGQFEIDEKTYELRHRGRTLRPSRLVFDTILLDAGQACAECRHEGTADRGPVARPYSQLRIPDAPER